MWGRVRDTLEKVCSCSKVEMKESLITVVSRKLNYDFARVEALWILNGDNTLKGLGKWSKLWAPYSDDGYRLYGAYGPRVMNQIQFVLNELGINRVSRRAVINIWRENPQLTKNYPCTVSLQFLIRSGFLDVIATMRSSDLWLGYPYDIFVFSCIAQYVRQNLFVKPFLGFLHMNVGSQHVYLKDLDKVKAVLAKPTENPSVSGNLSDIFTQKNTPDHILERLRNDVTHPIIL